MVDVDESSDEDLDRYEKIPVPKEKEKMKLKKNPPTYVFLKTNIKTVSGMLPNFENFQRKAPNNLVFRYVTKRTYPTLLALESGLHRRNLVIAATIQEICIVCIM